MGNRQTDLVQNGLQVLRDRLPNGWTAVLEARELTAKQGFGLDAVLSIEAPDEQRARLMIEAKTRMTPRDALFLGSMAARLDGVPLLVMSRFLSKATRERLREADLNWLDLTGNLRLVLTRPGLFIEAEGQQRRRGTSSSPARTLKGESAGRTVRALLAAMLPIGVRELAEQAGTDPGYASRVLDLLDKGALIERKPRGPVWRVDRPRLIRRWAEDAPLTTRGRIETFLEPRGLQTFLKRLQSTAVSYAITGSLAAQRWAPVAAARLAQLYVGDDPLDAAAQFELRPAENGANVQLIRPKDLAIISGASRGDDGLFYAAPVQVALDLLTSPGRAPSEGEELLKWMTERDDVWRA